MCRSIGASEGRSAVRRTAFLKKNPSFATGASLGRKLLQDRSIRVSVYVSYFTYPEGNGCGFCRWWARFRGLACRSIGASDPRRQQGEPGPKLVGCHGFTGSACVAPSLALPLGAWWSRAVVRSFFSFDCSSAFMAGFSGLGATSCTAG